VEDRCRATDTTYNGQTLGRRKKHAFLRMRQFQMVLLLLLLLLLLLSLQCSYLTN
jgi:hypothetical protein